jgi:hypothetical protein
MSVNGKDVKTVTVEIISRIFQKGIAEKPFLLSERAKTILQLLLSGF